MKVSLGKHLVKYLRLKAGGLSLTVTSRDDRHLDVVPTSHTLGTASKIVSSVLVSINAVATLLILTGEFTLTDTIALINVATTGASLTTVASIDKRNRDAFVCRFVGDKALQLGKAPIAHSPTLLATPFGTLTNICQVLHHQGISWVAGVHNLFGDNVICVLLKSLQAARHLLEVSFGRLCTFALQSTSEAEVAVIGFFDALATKETRMRGHGKTID